MSDCKELKNGNTCQLKQFQRNNYFYGKLMTVRDFEDEQAYVNEKRHLINRTIHGSGIVCGFTNISASDEGGSISLQFGEGGFAIDGCGREIIVPKTTAISLNDTRDIKEPGENYLYIRRKDCYAEMVAAASAASGCEEKCCPNRITEDFEIVVGDKPQRPSCEEIKSNYLEVCPSNSKKGAYIGFLEKRNNQWEFMSDEENRTYIPNSVSLSRRLECHIDDKNNPHKLKHSQLLEVLEVDPSKTDTVRDKHISNADARKWNSAIFKINNQPSDAEGNFTVEAGENVDIKTESSKITISSQNGSSCYTGVVVFEGIEEGRLYSSELIELPEIKIFSIMLGVEFRFASTVLITQGNLLLYQAGIALGSGFDKEKNKFAVSVMTQTGYKVLKVRWWAIGASEELGPMRIAEPKIDSRHLLIKIALKPDITLKELARETGLEADMLDVELKTLIDANLIRVTGRGANRKFRAITGE